jgi:hypothetical protein
VVPLLRQAVDGPLVGGLVVPLQTSFSHQRPCRSAASSVGGRCPARQFRFTYLTPASDLPLV